MLTTVEATTGWLKNYLAPYAAVPNTILGFEKQVLCRQGTPERIELANGTHFESNLIDTWAREYDIDWVCQILYHTPASGRTEYIWYNGVLKITLKVVIGGTFKHCCLHFS